MSYASEHPVRCLHDGCPASFPGSKHDAIKAGQAGWYFPRRDDGRGYCPDHLPEWVLRKRA